MAMVPDRSEGCRRISVRSPFENWTRSTQQLSSETCVRRQGIVWSRSRENYEENTASVSMTNGASFFDGRQAMPTKSRSSITTEEV